MQVSVELVFNNEGIWFDPTLLRTNELLTNALLIAGLSFGHLVTRHGLITSPPKVILYWNDLETESAWPSVVNHHGP
jgi:hypothetical protein